MEDRVGRESLGLLRRVSIRARAGTGSSPRRSNRRRVRLPTVRVLGLCALAACQAGREDVAIEPGADEEDSVETEAPVAESVDPVESTPREEVTPASSAHLPDLRSEGLTTASEPGEGPFTLGEGIERPRRLGNPGPIEGLLAMMRSGDYAWGSCIFQVTISETGEVGEVVFLKPEKPAPEVEQVITEGVRGWKFSPATRAGEPVAVYYHLVIHHCPLFRKDRGN